MHVFGLLSLHNLRRWFQHIFRDVRHLCAVYRGGYYWMFTKARVCVAQMSAGMKLYVFRFTHDNFLTHNI